MTEHRPIVSVITPAKDAGAWIAGAIASVRAQSFTDWEMIVMDDGSSDQTVALAHQAAEGDRRVRIERSQGDGGAGGTRNAALGLAQGRYIAFLDADDLWAPNKLEIQIGVMQKNSWVFSWTAYHVQKVEADGRLALPPYPVRAAKTQATRRDILAKRAAVGCLTAIYDTHALGKIPMPTIRKRQDFVLWTQIMAIAEERGWKTGGIDTPLAVYRHRKDSLSANKWSAARMQWKALVGHCGVSPLDAAWLFLSYAVRGIVDRIRIAR